MSISEILRLVEILAWPVVALVAMYVVKPRIESLLSGSKVKLSIAGQSIETTLPELKQVLEEHAGEPLSKEELAYLSSLAQAAKAYPNGIQDHEEQQFLRPMRNSGLVLTVPRNSFLQNAKIIELSALGRLYLRARAAVTTST